MQLSYKYEYIAYPVDALTINDRFTFRIRLQSHGHRSCPLEVNTVLGGRSFDQSLQFVLNKLSKFCVCLYVYMLQANISRNA